MGGKNIFFVKTWDVGCLFLNLHIKHRRVVVFLEGFVGVVLPGLVVVLEQQQRHLLERDGLSGAAVVLYVAFGEAFHVHHFQHHGEVEVHVEQFLFPLDADDGGGVELEILYFYWFHVISFCNFPAKMGKIRNFEASKLNYYA